MDFRDLVLKFCLNVQKKFKNYIILKFLINFNRL